MLPPALALGRVYLRSGRVREAIDALKVAIWSADTAAARIALAEAYIQTEDAAAARGELGATAARAELLSALADEHPAVVATAADALAKIGAHDSVVVATLVEAVRQNQSPNEPDIAVAVYIDPARDARCPDRRRQA